jgi:thiol-disulfide isomerase/thioredoxin
MLAVAFATVPPPRHPTRRRVIALGVAAAAFGGSLQVARAAHMVRPWTSGRAAPALDLADLDGKRWSLAAQRGQVVVLNFWATWCEPCRTEMPSLELLAQRHEHDGVLVLAVNFKEAAPAIRRFLQVQPVSIPILLDADGDATSAWTPRVFPSTVLVDRQGQPQTLVLGEMDWMGSEASALVRPLVAKRPT